MATPAFGLETGRDRALSTYRAMRVETASPQELVLILYNESLKVMREALAAIERKDLGDGCKHLLKAQDIVLTLRSSLNPSVAGEIALNLDAMYSFVGQRLMEANLKKAQEPINDALRVMGTLRDSWQEACCRHA